MTMSALEGGSVIRTLVIDDVRLYRPGRDEYVYIARTVEDGERMLWCAAPWDLVFLDHDMGGGATTRPIVDGLTEAEFNGELLPEVGQYYVHSINPVGATYLMRALQALGLNPYRLLGLH